MLSWHDNRIFDSHFLIYLLDLRTRSYRKKLARCLEYHYYLLKLVESYWQCVVHQVGERYGHPVAASTTSRQQSIGGPVARARLISAGVWRARTCTESSLEPAPAPEGEEAAQKVSAPPAPVLRYAPAVPRRAPIAPLQWAGGAPNELLRVRLAGPLRAGSLLTESPHLLPLFYSTRPPQQAAGVPRFPKLRCTQPAWAVRDMERSHTRHGREPYELCAPIVLWYALAVNGGSRNGDQGRSLGRNGQRARAAGSSGWAGCARWEGGSVGYPMDMGWITAEGNIYRVAGQSDLRGMVAVRLSRQALIAAAILDDEDVRALNERALTEEEKKQNEHWAELGGAIIEGGVARAAGLAGGEGSHTLSWIWYSAKAGAAADADDAKLHDALRLEWCKAYARAKRYSEDVRLLREEMRRTVAFAEGELPDSDPELTEGRRAYAAEHADTERKTCRRLEEKWAGILAKADQYLEGTVGLDAESVVTIEAG
ncbi:hypothetical protein B0H14DRAFT_3131652 [Mycena olivaceomarginata]|nr:hypothetical protein B0H14DRAFT_3131652 [Mycena olivaceomarginata]